MASSKQNNNPRASKRIDYSSNPCYFAAIFDRFYNMRSNMELCDVTLKVGNVTFAAHRLILAGNSPYIRNIFASENSGTLQQEIALPSIFREDTVRLILDYFYSGNLVINTDNCEELLSLASLLQV